VNNKYNVRKMHDMMNIPTYKLERVCLCFFFL